MTITINSSMLRSKRAEQHWSQSELCEASGLSLRTVQRMETEGRCSIDSVQAIAAAFNVPADDFLVSQRHAGIKRGVQFGFAGVAIGALASATSVFYSLQTVTITSADAGTSFGIIGAIAGLSCAFIGIMSHKIKLA